MSEVDKISFPSTKCGNSLIFGMRTPAKHQLDLTSMHMHANANTINNNKQQQQQFYYIPY
jgi:hypothetical protein